MLKKHAEDNYYARSDTHLYIQLQTTMYFLIFIYLFFFFLGGGGGGEWGREGYVVVVFKKKTKSSYDCHKSDYQISI